MSPVSRWPLTRVVLACGLSAGCATIPPSVFIVSVPVADVRATPGSDPAIGTHDPLEETQLLYGERVLVRERQDGWAHVEAVEQPEQTHHRRWEGYPGWVRERALSRSMDWKPNAVAGVRWVSVWPDGYAGGLPLATLPMGAFLTVTDTGGAMLRTRLLDGREGWVSPGDVSFMAALHRLPEEQRRKLILQAATALLGDAYVWGGRSPAGPGGVPVTGADCSGLVNLAYRAAGIMIPRDAHEQHLRARRVTSLQPADLVFLSAPDDPKKIVHVMLYAGEGWLIEGPGTGQAVRRISARERLGLSLDARCDGTRAGSQLVFLGSYFKR